MKKLTKNKQAAFQVDWHAEVKIIIALEILIAA